MPQNKGQVDYETGAKTPAAHLYWGWTKFHAEPVCCFGFFSDKKESLLKAFLTCTFIPWLLNFFNLPTFSQNWGKDTHWGWGVFDVVLPGRVWQMLAWKKDMSKGGWE